MPNRHIYMTTAPLCSGSRTPRKTETTLIDTALALTQTATPAPTTADPQIGEVERIKDVALGFTKADVSSPTMAAPAQQVSEAELTEKAIHTLLSMYPELGTDQGYVTALAQLPAGIIITAREAGPIGARAVLNKALKWKDTLLEAYPDLAQRPVQFAVALETPEEYMKDRSGGKYAGKEYADRFGGVR